MLTHGIPLDFPGGAHLFIPPTAIGSLQSRVCQVTHLRTDGVHCRESAGTGSLVLKVVPVTGAPFPGHHGPINVHSLFPHPLLVCSGNLQYYKSEMAIYHTGGVFSYLPHNLDLALEDSVGHSTCMSVLARRRAIMGWLAG